MQVRSLVDTAFGTEKKQKNGAFGLALVFHEQVSVVASLVLNNVTPKQRRASTSTRET